MLSKRVDDLVWRSRRQNIWIIGVKEGMEKGSPTELSGEVLISLRGMEQDTPACLSRGRSVCCGNSLSALLNSLFKTNRSLYRVNFQVHSSLRKC